MTIPAPTIVHTVPEAAKALAEEIRTKGHYQGQTGVPDAVCLVVNTVTPNMEEGLKMSLLTEIRDRAKHLIGFPTHLGVCGPRTEIVHWNDHAPTEVVLSVLDSIASAG